jgi:hypothetical protein
MLDTITNIWHYTIEYRCHHKVSVETTSKYLNGSELMEDTLCPKCLKNSMLDTEILQPVRYKRVYVRIIDISRAKQLGCIFLTYRNISGIIFSVMDNKKNIDAPELMTFQEAVRFAQNEREQYERVPNSSVDHPVIGELFTNLNTEE